MDNTKRRAGRAGGPCCQMKNMNYPRAGELHRRAGQQAAIQDWPVGCTLREVGGLHIKPGCGKGRSGGLPFSAAHPFLCSPPARPSVLSSVQPAGSSPFSFGNMALQPARPVSPPISVICMLLFASKPNLCSFKNNLVILTIFSVSHTVVFETTTKS